MIKTDIIIIGAGPVGLFTIFEAGLMKLHCHVIDAIPQVGGQLKEIYPKKPIYDIPGFPSVLAGDLIDNLEKQADPFQPGFTLGERAESIEKQEDGSFIVTTIEGTQHQAPAVIIAGGLGSFEPRKPLIENLEKFEKRGIEYMVREPEAFLDKRLFISGGGDSALDWAIYFAEQSHLPVGLVHRSDMFRALKDSVEQVYKLQEKGKIELYTHAEIKDVNGDEILETIELHQKEKSPKTIAVDYWLPLFGLSPKLGPICNWGLEIEKNAIKVDHTLDYQTNTPGVFAVGDVNTYPGKLKLILCGFHEATLAVQSCYKIINPDKKFTMKYTTVQGIQGFEKVVNPL
ncbi:MAG: NAD(P)/FAD-dependent oxidoreductase [Flavobacteriaceae bacterium TMED42]|nr:MAG: NAD(P)/FAD-dependent oxidoreductase [Flavobacteriaceae bacterium TMED42]|tara:strand:- start:8 stop:1039 length:1032 start_codon:yes stop_codon:yes gene_type:complete